MSLLLLRKQTRSEPSILLKYVIEAFTLGCHSPRRDQDSEITHHSRHFPSPLETDWNWKSHEYSSRNTYVSPGFLLGFFSLECT